MNVLKRLAADAFNDSYFREIVDDLFEKYSSLCLERSEKFQYSELEYASDLLRFIDILSFSDEKEIRNFTIQLVDIVDSISVRSELVMNRLRAALINLGIFPSIHHIENDIEGNMLALPEDRVITRIAKEIVQAVPHQEETFFTDIQFQIFKQLSKVNYLSISGPTSLGKSFILEAFLNDLMLKEERPNICVIVPTRALISQFSSSIYNHLSETLESQKYFLFTNSNVESVLLFEGVGLILVLTPERLISYLSVKSNPPLHCLFVDEAHKLAAPEDTRSITLFSAINQCIRNHKNVRVYFSSPYIRNPEILPRLFHLPSDDSFSTGEFPVAQNLFFLDLITSSGFYQSIAGRRDVSETVAKYLTKDHFLKHLGTDSNNLIYCNSRDETRKRCHEFFGHLSQEEIVQDKIVRRAITQIRQYIHKDYYLAAYLSRGVAFHFGTLPQVVRSLIEDLFSQQKIHFLFCTSTLLEGVNLPARNVFILNEKKGNKQMLPIDIWNLAGRAGRLGKELGGNVFCVRTDENHWKQTKILGTRDEIKITPTILEQTLGETGTLEGIFENENSGRNQRERDLLNYIAGLLSVECHSQLTSGYAPIRDHLRERRKDELLELARTNIQKINVPLSLLQKHESIRLRIQENVFQRILLVSRNGGEVRLQSKINYESILLQLEIFHGLYEWGKTEPKLLNTQDPQKQKNVLKYLAVLANGWINGFSLNAMIANAISFNEQRAELGKEFFIQFKSVGKFDSSNPVHVNVVINDLIEDIESKIRYTLQKYFDHYHSMLVEVLGEDEAGPNWAAFLEYGAQDTVNIALQNLGLSRHVASLIRKDYALFMSVKDGKLEKLNLEGILHHLSEESIEYFELSRLSNRISIR